MGKPYWIKSADHYDERGEVTQEMLEDGRSGFIGLPKAMVERLRFNLPRLSFHAKWYRNRADNA